MLGVRPRSPGARPAPWWAPQPDGAGPAKRRRRLLDEPADPEPPAPPGPPDPAGSPAAAAAAAAAATASVLVVAAGCAVQVSVDGVDVLLEPEPTSVLQVSLQGHTLILVPEGLLGLPEARPGELGDDVVVIEQGGFCAATPEGAGHQEVCLVEDADPEFLVTWVDAAAGWEPGRVAGPRPLSPSPSPERRAAGPEGDLVHLLSPFPRSPGSALKPLPPSPPPSPQASVQRPPRPWCKARRRLF
uniref:proline-rich protein 23A-like n=1 Tax=Jaculus jaculus TaxID=51337 RepID=UPI001E1AF5B4|nr:proline-rich protein 23A-like [Jaculus jaculus]